MARLARWCADTLDPPPPRTHPLANAVVAGARRENAMALMDEETRGYLLVIVRADHGQEHVQMGLAVDDSMWPAVKATAVQMLCEGDRVYAK